MAATLTPAEQELIQRLCSILCSTSELVELMGYPQDELEARVMATYGKGLEDFRSEYAAVGKRNLRAAQMKTALDGNVTMQIWLGKQLLGQKDAPDISDQRPAVSSKEVPLNVILNRHAQRRAPGARAGSA